MLPKLVNRYNRFTGQVRYQVSGFRFQGSSKQTGTGVKTPMSATQTGMTGITGMTGMLLD